MDIEDDWWVLRWTAEQPAPRPPCWLVVMMSAGFCLLIMLFRGEIGELKEWWRAFKDDCIYRKYRKEDTKWKE